MGLLKNIIKAAAGYKEIEFKVAGVTFKNGKESRQKLIRAIKWHDAPYRGDVRITFERYEYEGQLAIGVYANDHQLGNVPKEYIEDFDKKWTGKYLIEKYEVLGNEEPFGFLVKVLFDK